MFERVVMLLAFLDLSRRGLSVADGQDFRPTIKNCASVSCPTSICPNPLPAPKGQCCPVCPEGCTYYERFYKVGAIFPAEDGCNKCNCIVPDRIICTKTPCSHLKECVEDGVFYKIGDTFMAEDGCNKCICTSGGAIACTRNSCGCSLNGIHYKKGDIFLGSDGCSTCICTSTGDVSCTKDCVCPVKGQVFTSCASACPPANCTNPAPICTRQCVPRCQCPSGTVIDESSNTCIAVENCPRKCPPGDELVNCSVDQCQIALCPAHSDAMCVVDPCRGCNARFFVEDTDITHSCQDSDSSTPNSAS